MISLMNHYWCPLLTIIHPVALWQPQIFQCPGARWSALPSQKARQQQSHWPDLAGWSFLEWSYCTIFQAIFWGDMPWNFALKSRPTSMVATSNLSQKKSSLRKKGPFQDWNLCCLEGSTAFWRHTPPSPRLWMVCKILHRLGFLLGFLWNTIDKGGITR